PSAFGARLLMPLFAIYTLFVVYRIGTRLGSWKHGLIAAGVLATFNLFLGRTRAVNIDMPLLAGITTTLLLLLENRSSWKVALAISISVLFNGPTGFLTMIIALPLFFSKKRKYLLHTIYYLLLIILPWHLYTYLKYGTEYITPYLSEQVFRRATAQIEFHFEDRWYYFVYLYENLGLGVLLVAAIGGIFSVRQFISRSKNRIFHLTLLWWVFIPLSIFTLAKTRLFWYILPVYPALALLIAEAIGSWKLDKNSSRVVSILAIGICFQALLVSSRSVEVSKVTAPMPDRLYVAQELGKLKSGTLSILVPPSGSQSKTLLPDVDNVNSSSRYGEMPSVVYYYAGPVEFFYDVDKFRAYWDTTSDPIVMISSDDLPLLSPDYQILATTATYLGISKEQK
ncbi:MAG: hypothetical protein ABII80_02965, partial [bacterium]